MRAGAALPLDWERFVSHLLGLGFGIGKLGVEMLGEYCKALHVSPLGLLRSPEAWEQVAFAHDLTWIEGDSAALRC